MMRTIAALADAALLLPAAIVLVAYLLHAGQFTAARLWCLALGACGLETIGFKLLFHACGPALTDYEVISPSGHVSLATTFYGCLAILVGTARPRWHQLALALGLVLFILMVGVSRVRTGAHSAEEVMVGLAIGAFCAALFWALHRRAGRPAVSPVPLAIGFVAALIVLGGSHFSLEPLIGGAARRLSAMLDVCRPGDVAASVPRQGGSLAAMLQIRPWLVPN